MPTIDLNLVANTNSLGTNVFLQSANKKYHECLAENLENNPLANLVDSLPSGFVFRSPNIQTEDWEQMLKTLYSLEGTFSIRAILERKKDTPDTVIGYATFENKDDAAIFAWSNVEQWQKWDDAKEAEYQEEKKKQPVKPTINKDGSVTVTVQVSSISGS
jgi:hypothetical protein